MKMAVSSSPAILSPLAACRAMLRPLQRPRSWTSTGYVCRTCRQHLHSARRLENTAVAAAEAGAEDDWFSNFNDLSVELATDVPRDVSGESAQASEKQYRRRLSTPKQPSPLTSKTRLRPLAPGHPAIRNAAWMSLPTEELVSKLRKLRHNLNKEETSTDMTRPSVAESTSDSRPRATAFTRSSAARLRSKIATCDHVIELRKQGLLEEPEQRRSSLPAPSRNKATEVLEKELNDLRIMLAFKESQQSGNSSTDAHAGAELLGQKSLRRTKRYHIGERIKLYEKVLHSRKLQIDPQVGAEGHDLRAPTHASADGSNQKEQYARAESPARLPASVHRGLDDVIAQLQQELMNKSETHGSVDGRIDGDKSRDNFASSGQNGIHQSRSIPSFGPIPEPSTVAHPRTGGRRPTIAQQVREARDRPKWGGIASSGAAGSAGEGKNSLPLKRSLERGLGYLQDSLAKAIENRDNTPASNERINSIERNIKAYKDVNRRPSESNAADEEGKASENLASLHQESSLVTKEKGMDGVAPKPTPEPKKPTRPGKEDSSGAEPAKPSKSGGRVARRGARAAPKRARSVAKRAPKSKARGTHDAPDGGDSDEHRKLSEVMKRAQFGVTAPGAVRSSGKDAATATEPNSPPLEPTSDSPPSIASVRAADLRIHALNIPQPSVPCLEYGLDKVLFNPGVYFLQDPSSRVYNFDPYLQDIMPAVDFDFNALKEYKTSSQDRVLSTIAKEHKKRYIGSTSSMTSTLGHFHYLLSNWRPVNLKMLSRGFSYARDDFTRINKAPTATFLRWKPESQTYAIDADKEFDGANVLMMLGKSMEKMLTLPTSDFEKYRKSDPREVPQEARDKPEAFEYTTMGDFLMRSQLDAYDPRLPGTGMFDLKTRAVLSVRMDVEEFKPMIGYELHTLQGAFNSYEREYYDMMRATMLKYMLQVRMGRMQGIFAAYHNIERIFGFQYISLMDMDRALHGQLDPCLGDQEFKLSLDLLNKALDKATAKFPEKSLRIHFETTQQNLGGTEATPVMSIFAEPMEEKEIDRIQTLSKAKVREFERNIMGIEDRHASPEPEEEAPTEYPPATPEPDPEAEESTEIGNGEEREDQAPTEYPPATPEPGPKQAADDQAPTEYPPATPEPPREPSETSEQDPAEEDSVPTTYPPTTPEPPSPSSPNPDLTSSSAADSHFISTLSAPTASSGFPPLFAATLMIKSKVNDVHVPRPTTLKPDDDWRVEYLLTEYPESEATWSRYEAVKGRRREVLSKERDEDEDAAFESKGDGESGDGAKKKADGFIEFLRGLAAKGREFRKEMDEVEKGKEKKFAWKQAPTPTGSGIKSVAEAMEPVSTTGVEDVGGYMGWLYGERGRKM